MTARANQITGLTNGRAANWALEVVFSPFRTLSRRQLTFSSCCKISLITWLERTAGLCGLLFASQDGCSNDRGTQRQLLAKFKILHKNMILRRFWKHFFIFFFLLGKEEPFRTPRMTLRKFPVPSQVWGNIPRQRTLCYQFPASNQKIHYVKNKNTCPDFAFFRVALECKGS